jgi:hypothetical protein
VLPWGALPICQATKARVRGPTQARPEIDSGARVPVIAVDAVRRIASGPRSRTTAPFAPPAPRLRDSNSTEPRPSAAWFSRLARNPKTVSRVAGISRVAAISRRAPNRVERVAARPRLTIRRKSAAVSRGCGATYALRRRRFAKSPSARGQRHPGSGVRAPQWSHGVAAITTVVARDPATTLRRGMSRAHIQKDAGAAETFRGAPRSQPRPASCHAAPHVFPTLQGPTRPGDEDVGTGWLSSEGTGWDALHGSPAWVRSRHRPMSASRANGEHEGLGKRSVVGGVFSDDRTLRRFKWRR